jgi:hypothetical protein
VAAAYTQIGDFFLAQMGDVFGGGVCFDNRAEGEWGAVERRPPLATKLSAGQPCGIGAGQSEGPVPGMMGHRPHRGGHGRTARGPAQR